MKKSATLISIFFVLSSVSGLAQTDWTVLWEIHPPVGAPSGAPYAWMNGPAAFTGLAYDQTRDVLYIVNPGLCQSGPTQTICPKVHIWEASTGNPATNVGINGELDVDTNIVKGGFNAGRFALYKIDVDDDGRIFACNVVAPIWTNAGAWKLYRWLDPGSKPELAYETQGTPGNADMIDAMWGTSFDVIGRTYGADPSMDSVRIFVSGGDLPGLVNDEINVFVSDTRPGTNYPYRLGLKMPFFQAGTNYAGSGIAATLPGLTSPVLASNATSATVLVNQRQTPSATLPQTYNASVYGTLPPQMSGAGGPLSFQPPTASHYSHLIIADQMPQQGLAVNNKNTHVRSVAFSANPPIMWPPTATPALGTEVFDNLVGSDNYITDVDHNVFVDPVTGMQHIQLYVLMSNNGIAAYRSVDPMPVPVEFSAFAANVTGDEVQLLWQVAYESNNHGFQVQRSYNSGSDWENIGFVPGNGTSDKLAEFTYDDPLTPAHRDAGTVLYRLKQLDNDGTYAYSPIAEALVALPPDGVLLSQNYPNPFNPSTTISYGLHEAGQVSLDVYNTYGEHIATVVDETQSRGMHHAKFTAENLPSGVYLYRLTANGTTAQKSMVLTR